VTGQASVPKRKGGWRILRVRLVPIREAAADARLLDRWAELESRALEPNPFFAPQMVLPAARHLEDGRAAQLLVAEQGDELRFLLPVSGSSGLRRLAIAGLRPWMHDYCFLGTPLLAADGDPDRVWAAVIEHLRRRSPAPVLVIPLHPAQGPVAAALHRAGLGAGFAIRRSPTASRGFVLRRPEPTYAREWMSRKHLANQSRRRRHLGKALGTEVVTVERDVDGFDKAVERFLELESKGWKGRSRTALSCRPGHDRFFREMTRGFADCGRLMFLSMEAGSQVVAQNTALVAGEGLFGFKRAYDEEFSRWSPGSLLDLDVLDWFHRSAPLAWLDTCSAPEDGTGSRAFGDRRPLCTLAVPLSPLGAAAAVMVPAGARARRYVRDTRAGRLVRQRRHARKKG
jgi:CelD/BcsL family acetyltransferase involved in cellulose biosynthesis